MVSDIQLIEREIGNVLEIEERVPVWKMPMTMSRDFPALFEYAQNEGANPTEAYARYMEIDLEAEVSKGMLANFLGMFTKKWHFFVGVPTASALEPGDRMVAGFLEKQRYVQGMHKGPYRKVGESYERMLAWITEQGLTAQNECIEFYLNDPSEVKQEELETRILIPVR
jgi:hypothetical protein